jgi:hypothetical protein
LLQKWFRLETNEIFHVTTGGNDNNEHANIMVSDKGFRKFKIFMSIAIRTINKKYTPRNNIIIGLPKDDKKYEQKLELGEFDMATKSEALKRIDDFRRQTLIDLYNRCTQEQQNLFNRMYVSVETIPDEKIDWAIQQCERTIAENEAKKE